MTPPYMWLWNSGWIDTYKTRLPTDEMQCYERKGSGLRGTTRQVLVGFFLCVVPPALPGAHLIRSKTGADCWGRGRAAGLDRAVSSVGSRGASVFRCRRRHCAAGCCTARPCVPDRWRYSKTSLNRPTDLTGLFMEVVGLGG